MVISSLFVANSFIMKAFDEKKSITHMKLQKLLYMVYACYLARFREPLFSDRFEAWQYGPVICNVYNEFKEYGSKNIDTPHVSADGQIYYAIEADQFGECMGLVWSQYKDHSGPELSRITHADGTAWSKKLLGQLLDDKDIVDDGIKWFGYSA